MKLTKAQRLEVAKVRDGVQKTPEEQRKIFDNLADGLHIRKRSPEWYLLWDFVYNDFRHCLGQHKEYERN